MKIKQINSVLFIFALAFLFLTPNFKIANAQPTSTPPPVQRLENPLCPTGAPEAQCSLPAIIGRVIKAVMGIVGAVALLMFVYGGFLWLTAGGSEERVKKGRDVLTWAVIGLVTIFTAYAVLSFIITKLTGAAGE